ncbi:hypothetical protein M9Y10_019349 [Tritrichomonas musculus]|uniref:protein-serine/threonine phosphatase n=1 Tax=Tritrichomonas musculus TaxID=1915356 RepID=A0ABR2HK60_9EUKA
MFLGTYHSKLYGKSEYDTIAVEDTYNLLKSNKTIDLCGHLPIERENLIQICDLAKKCLLEDKTLLRIKPRVRIIGDLRGNYNHIWDMICGNEPTDQFLFLGDYVNNGKNSIEVITLVLCMKLIAPNQVFLLRGRQETPNMTDNCGFKEECLSCFDKEIYDKFLEVFECLPLAAIITDIDKTKSILCMNGGLSPNLTNVDQIDQIERPIKNVEKGLPYEILFSDPSAEITKFTPNKSVKGAYLYGKTAAHTFLKNNELDHIVTSHQFSKNGYSYPFNEDHSVFSIFSTPDYNDGNGKFNTNAGVNLYLRESMLYTISRVNDSKNNDTA